MVELGQEAHNFELPSHTGDIVSLSDYRGSKNVILSFHIFSFTGGWTHQVSSFRIANDQFEEADTQALGISTDARATQTAFAASLGNIPYPVLSDFHPKGHVSTAFGVYNQDRGTSDRAIVIIDKEGIIRFRKIYSTATDLNTADILDEINAL